MSARFGDALRRYAGNVERQTAVALRAASETLVLAIDSELAKPGTGRIRRKGRDRVGKGSFVNRKESGVQILTATGRHAKRRLTRGRAKTNIDTTNRASAPGDPPAPDTGNLRSSITYEIDGLKARVGTNVEYAAPLEFGTGARLAPRPFMRPALQKVRGTLGADILAILKRAGA